MQPGAVSAGTAGDSSSFRPVPSASDASDADAVPGVCGLPGADAAAGSVLFMPHSAAGVFAVRAASSWVVLSVGFISDDRKR